MRLCVSHFQEELIEESTDQVLVDKTLALVKCHGFSTDHLYVVVQTAYNSLHIIVFMDNHCKGLVENASQLTLLMGNRYIFFDYVFLMCVCRGLKSAHLKDRVEVFFRGEI